MMHDDPSRATGATEISVGVKPKNPVEPKRLNRAVGVGEALSGVLDAALKKRGFATKDIFTHWAVMAPKPYDAVAVPDQLKWPRGAGHEGATLYLRCAAGHALALSHEGPLISAAVNRYFGYFLVKDVRLSAERFRPNAIKAIRSTGLSPEVSREADDAVAEIGDAGLKDALKSLGEALLSRKTRTDVTKA